MMRQQRLHVDLVVEVDHPSPRHPLSQTRPGQEGGLHSESWQTDQAVALLVTSSTTRSSSMGVPGE